MLVFDNVEFSVQRMQNSFLCNLWSWSKVSIDAGPISPFSFIDWLGSRKKQQTKNTFSHGLFITINNEYEIKCTKATIQICNI